MNCIYELRMKVYQIYKENIYDLLHEENKQLKIRFDNNIG